MNMNRANNRLKLKKRLSMNRANNRFKSKKRKSMNKYNNRFKLKKRVLHKLKFTKRTTKFFLRSEI